MKNIKLILLGLDINEELPEIENTGKQETFVKQEEKKEKITIETEEVELTKEIPDIKKMVSIPQDLLESLVALAAAGKGKKADKDNSGSDDKFEKSMAVLTSAIQGIAATDNKFIGMKPISVEEVDKDDVLPQPATFFCYSIQYTIWDDQKFGRTVSVPYGRPIKFKMVYRTVDKAIPKQPKYVTVAAYTTFSKKIEAFIRGHSAFGVKFFERKEQMKDVDAAMAEKLAMAFNIVQRLQEQEIIAACSREGVTIDTQDFDELRRRLAMKRARAMAKENVALKDRAVKDLLDFQEGKIPFVTDGTTNVNNVAVSAAQRAEAGKANAGVVSPY